MSSLAAVRRPARALFQASVRLGSPEHVAEELGAFVALLEAHDGLRQALTNRAVPPAAKRGIVARLLELQPASPLVAGILELVAERDEVGELPALLEAFQERLLEHHHVVRADVTTAAPLTSERMEAIQQSLADATGRRVLVTPRVEPSILGGVVAKLGSRVYDGSVTRQLERIRERLASIN